MPIFKAQRLKSKVQNRFIKNPFIFRLVPKKGFTLVELLISVAIIAILSTIGVASFNNYSGREAAKNAAFELQSELRKYQNYMISGQQNLKPDVTDACYQAGYKPKEMVYGIYKVSGTTPSQLYIKATYDYYCNSPPYCSWGNCSFSGTPTSPLKVWPDPKVSQVIDVGFNLKGVNDKTCNIVYIWFYPGKDIPKLFSGGCVATMDFNYNADRLYIDLGKGTTRYYRVYVTTGGMIYVQKI